MKALFKFELLKKVSEYPPSILPIFKKQSLMMVFYYQYRAVAGRYGGFSEVIPTLRLVLKQKSTDYRLCSGVLRRGKLTMQ